MKHFSGAPLYGRLQALPTNIRLGWKGLPETNALAYYEKAQLTAVKCFITLAPCPSIALSHKISQFIFLAAATFSITTITFTLTTLSLMTSSRIES